MTKCNRENCTSCTFIKEGKQIKINRAPWNINRKLNCNSFNVVYAIICKKDTCKQVYIAATGHHFTLPGHSLADLQVTAIEQVKKRNTLYRREKEEYHIRRFNTLYEGLNKEL